MNYTLALTGGSGALYFTRLIERLKDSPFNIELISSPTGRQVLQHETGKTWEQVTGNRCSLDENQMASRVSSGSSPTEALVILPCSMSTLSHIANGTAQNLIHRAAAVQLKERRKLIVVPREAPYSLIHLRAMTTVTEAGGIILPASPGFYHQPKSILDLVDNVVDRVLDHMNCPSHTIRRWTP